MIAVNTEIPVKRTHKVRCPECRWRICDVVDDGNTACKHKIVSNRLSDSNLVIKCQRCGSIIGFSFINKI